MKMIFRTGFNYDVYDPDVLSFESGLSCPEASLTQQQFAEECDINEILRKFNITGQLPDNLAPPQYGDFIGIADYHDAMNAVVKAQEAFMEMPASIRDRFHNDPGAFVDFCSNEANRSEMEKMGLVLPQVAADLAPSSPVVSVGSVPSDSGTPPTSSAG